MAKPTMVFVPGAWHSPEIYQATMDILEELEYSTVGLSLPSVGADPPHDSFDGDVEAIRDCLTSLIEDQGKDVILVSHSVSGMAASEAPIGLVKSQREAKGFSGGVIRMVYIMAFAMPEGFGPTAGGAQYPAWMKHDEDKGIVTVAPDDAQKIFYSDLPLEEAAKWTAILEHQSEGVYHSTTTFAAWRYVPSTFVIGMQDKSSLSPDVCKFMIDSARKEVPTAFDVVEKCETGGHCLMISHPEWLAKVMRRAAGEKI